MTPISRSRAFSLLELVVVMAIIAVATTMLVVTVVKVRDNAGDVTCQSNLRQLLSALEMYNVEYNGSMPYGFMFAGSGPPTWEAPNTGLPPGAEGSHISWASELNKYFPGASSNAPAYASAFRCPTAQQQAGAHLVSYVMNMIVAVAPRWELQVDALPPRAQFKPPSLHLMLPTRTALIWDTAIRPNPIFPEGYLLGADIDGQRFWNGARTPQFRYFSPHDPFGQIPPGIFGQSRPMQLTVGSSVYRNIDPPADLEHFFSYQGNLRFRHNNQTQCNVAFSDGSVQQFTAVVNLNNTVASHDALRRLFMITWPPGVPPNPDIVH